MIGKLADTGLSYKGDITMWYRCRIQNSLTILEANTAYDAAIAITKQRVNFCKGSVYNQPLIYVSDDGTKIVEIWEDNDEL